LQAKAASIIPTQFADLGELVAIDGSLIDACLTMIWADYRNNTKKEKIHRGFDVSNGGSDICMYIT